MQPDGPGIGGKPLFDGVSDTLLFGAEGNRIDPKKSLPSELDRDGITLFEKKPQHEG